MPSLSRILPALQNAGVAIDREQTFWIDHRRRHAPLRHQPDRRRRIAAKLAKPGVAEVAEELFAALFNDEAEDGRLNGLTIEGGLSMREVQLVRAYISYWRQAGSKFSTRYMAETLRSRADLVARAGGRLPAALRPERWAKTSAPPATPSWPTLKAAWPRSTTPTPRKSWPRWSTS